MAEKTDLIDVIVSDHREFQRVFDQLMNRECPDEKRKDLVDHVIAELVRHSIAEEMYLYPAAREHLSDGDEVADHELQEHAEAEETMKRLDGMDASDPEFEPTVSTLIEEIRHHLEEEEGDLLPRLRSACSQEQLDGLGRKVLEAKKIAPTRPHPMAPDEPPLNKLLAPGTGIVDKMRDALSGRNR